jgi:class 3 adenylate cyclase
VLFCDLVGFTAASEQLDPEDVRARVVPYQQRLRAEIERYGGTVEKFIGDAVMAVFGAPVAHEDDAERAVHAGLRILEAIDDLNAVAPGRELQVRIGINTGEAVVALDAQPERGEGIVTGDVVNTAARIQSAGSVNAVTVSEPTYRATSRVFEFEQLEPVSVKGKSEPIAIWSAKAARARFGSDILRPHGGRLVGRELEKPLLIGAFERACQQRLVQLVTIVGEPGVGKSRLIAELLGYVDEKPEITRWRQGRCLPYGDGITFWALGEIIKAEAGILETDSSDTATSKLAAAVASDASESEQQWLLQRLAPLVGAETESTADSQELFTAWRLFLEELAAARQTVLVFEDLHWADDALLGFLQHLAEWSAGVPLLVLCAARPELFERRPSWGAGLRNAHTLNLSPLSEAETTDLVAELVTSASVGRDLQAAIVERAGGNPLYAEELVRFATDRGLESVEVLPDSVQALIAARLDTLSPERKSLLQDAAVIGKVFWADALAEIGTRDRADIELALHELTRKELIRPARTSSMEGESEYSFWHLLVRDVAYAQIPRAERARRHSAAAGWIERKAGGRVEDLAEVVAYHYLQALELALAAGDTGQADELSAMARRFLTLAGERALGLDTTQAEVRLAHALELTPNNDPPPASLVVLWADAASQAGHAPEAAEALDRELDSLRSGGDTETAAQALQLRSRLAFRLGEGRQVSFAAEAVTLLEREPPGPALVAAYEQLANAEFLAGSNARSLAAADRAGALAKQLGLPEPARALAYRGVCRAYLGDREGIAEMERALASLVKSGKTRDAAAVQNNLALVRYAIEGPARALEAFEDTVAFCKERGLVEGASHAEANCPGLEAELGRTADALKRAARLAADAEVRGDDATLIELRAVELTTSVAVGQVESPLRTATQLAEMARSSGAADEFVVGLAAATAGSAAEAPGETRKLLRELADAPGIREGTYYARHLPGIVRTALNIGDGDLANRLADGLGNRYPLDDNVRFTVLALLAEHSGAHAEAARLYADAAQGWQQFGNLPEQAHALLSHGRCLVALRTDADEPLLQALSLFTTMRYAPARAETDALLSTGRAAATSA